MINTLFNFSAVLSSNSLINANYTRFINLIKAETNYTKPKLGTKFLHNLQLELESKFLTDVISCLKICGDWDSLISTGSVCRTFF